MIFKSPAGQVSAIAPPSGNAGISSAFNERPAGFTTKENKAMKKIFILLIAALISIVLAAPVSAETVAAGRSYTTMLHGGKVLTITAPSGTTGTVFRLARKPGDGTIQSTTSVSSADLIFGPYEDSERFQVDCTAGTITVASAYSDPRPTLKTILMKAVDYTLSAAESLGNILLVTGSASGMAIIAPSVAESGVSRMYTVRNGSADSNDVDIKIDGGSGVTVGSGKTAIVYYNGSDYARQTADATN